MKLLFDQNISYKILKHLSEQYTGSSHVKKEKLINKPDKTIWEFAKESGFTIVTQDSDFNDLCTFYGFPPKIIWIRTGNLKTSELLKIFNNFITDIEIFINHANYGCFEIFKINPF